MEEKTLQNQKQTYTDPITGKFIEGNPGGGRPKDTPEMKIIKKATKELIAEYKEGLGEALSLIKPVLIAKALEGDVPAIKEIHDRVMDKAKQATDITSNGKTIVLPVEILNKNATNSSTSEDSEIN